MPPLHPSDFVTPLGMVHFQILKVFVSIFPNISLKCLPKRNKRSRKTLYKGSMPLAFFFFLFLNLLLLFSSIQDEFYCSIQITNTQKQMTKLFFIFVQIFSVLFYNIFIADLPLFTTAPSAYISKKSFHLLFFHCF